MKYKFRLYTQHEHEVFSPSAFERNIGKEIPVTPNTKGTVLSAEVVSHGSWADLLIEVPDDSDAAEFLRRGDGQGHYSIVEEPNAKGS